jgi:pimeloyl-ACP methyl ester carboxylesterase
MSVNRISPSFCLDNHRALGRPAGALPARRLRAGGDPVPPVAAVLARHAVDDGAVEDRTSPASRPDSPGFGLSDPLGVGEAQMQDFAEAAIEFMDALGVERAAVYGFHTGAMICACDRRSLSGSASPARRPTAT